MPRPYALKAQAFAHGDLASDPSIPLTLEKQLRPFVRGKVARGSVMRVRTPDDGDAEFEISIEGDGFSVRSSYGGEMADLIYRCAEAANLAILARRIPVTLTSAGQLVHLPEDVIDPVLIESGGELMRLIEHDGIVWKTARMRLVRAIGGQK